MEKTFILTGLRILMTGIGLGLLVEWIFRKENERTDDDGSTGERN